MKQVQGNFALNLETSSSVFICHLHKYCATYTLPGYTAMQNEDMKKKLYNNAWGETDTVSVQHNVFANTAEWQLWCSCALMSYYLSRCQHISNISNIIITLLHLINENINNPAKCSGCVM